eukprot:TRINITY_DN4729_c0_g6_i1.p1 TRINITY_DN4729_c0_g6~~TRINITY_DN4729_c0_g6_i1.p1  ORF type:complete len:273 (-),score=91.04 TRINITY_DN4729_c0_g6_i1:13-831(-)
MWKAVKKTYNISSSTSASMFRGKAPTQVMEGASRFKRPNEMLTLYVKESCPWSRKVREAFTVLDLDANVRPCPIEGTKFRPELKRIGGKEQLPFIIDGDVKMYESKDIVEYLFDNYGPGKDKIPSLMRDTYMATFTSKLSTIARSMPWHGLLQYKGDTATSLATLIPRKLVSEPHEEKPEMAKLDKPIHLWSFENSPYCRIVREALDSLEIPYILHNVAKGSEKRGVFAQMSGKMQVPFLIDENKDKKMFESQDIVDYLYENYTPKKDNSKK